MSNKTNKNKLNQYSVIELVSAMPGNTATELAHSSGRNVNSLSSRLTKLVNRRVIKRKLQPSDYRNAKSYRYFPKAERVR